MAFSVVRTCPHCGSKNRIPSGRLADEARCGACKAGLGQQAEPIDVDEQAFGEIVSSAKVPVLVDFWASWCGPCRAAAPEVKALAKEMAGAAVVLKVNTEEHPALAGRFGVQSIPNFVVLRDGKIVKQTAGLAPRSEMRRWLQAS